MKAWCTFFEVKFKSNSMDYNAISLNFFRPERSRLLEIMECVLGRAPDPTRIEEELEKLGHGHNEEGLGKGKSAWELLAARGLIPMNWVDEPRRRFHLGSSKDLRTHPSSKMAVLLASDLQGVMAVEELAREFVARTRMWGRPTPSLALWKMGKHLPRGLRQQIGEVPLGEPDPTQRGSLDFRFSIPKVQRARLPELQLEGQANVVPNRLLPAIYNHRWWELAVQEGWKITRSTLDGFSSEMNLSAELEGRTFADFKNPFTPLLGIWERGYALIGLAEEQFVLFICRTVFPDLMNLPPDNYCEVGVPRVFGRFRILWQPKTLREQEFAANIQEAPDMASLHNIAEKIIQAKKQKEIDSEALIQLRRLYASRYWSQWQSEGKTSWGIRPDP